MIYYYHDHLESGRLLTRFLTLDDIPWWTDFFRHEAAVRHLGPFVLDTPEASSKSWIERQLQRYADQRFGLQAIVLKETGEPVGQCGLLFQDVDGVPEVEVGYHIMPTFWGNGYAPEAARMFIDYAFTNQFSDHVISIIEKTNVNSQKVAIKNGLKIWKSTIWQVFDVDIWRVDA